MKKLSFRKLMENKKFAIAFSLFIAVIVWFIVVIQFDSNTTRTVRNITVDDTMNSSQLEELGLEIIRIEPATVSVRVEGIQYRISLLGNDDINVTLSAAEIAAKVQEAGTYELKVTAEQAVSSNDYQIIGTVPATVSVTFDKVTSKTITLEPEAPNITVENDYIRENLVAEPETLTIKGAEQDIDKIARGVLVANQTEALTQTKTFDANLVLYDKDGNVLKNSMFEFNREDFQITVVVYRQAEIPLTFQYQNVPSNLDTDNLEYTMSLSTVTVAGPADAVQNLQEISLGYIDIRELTIGRTFKFSIPIPSGFKNIGTETEVEINFDDSGWALASDLTVTDINFLNKPSGYEITMESTGIKNISVVGQKYVVEGITADDLAATVDFSSLTITEGTQTVPVTIEVYNKDFAWVVGAYECTITAVKS